MDKSLLFNALIISLELPLVVSYFGIFITLFGYFGYITVYTLIINHSYIIFVVFVGLVALIAMFIAFPIYIFAENESQREKFRHILRWHVSLGNRNDKITVLKFLLIIYGLIICSVIATYLINYFNIFQVN